MGIEAHHVALTVLDISRAKKWYGEALGFEPQLEFTLPSGARGAMLRSAGGARIELFQVPDPQDGLHDADPPTAMRRRGFGHVGLATEDLPTTFATAIAAGATPVWEPRPSPEPGRWMAFIHDPDGNLVELIGPES